MSSANEARSSFASQSSAKEARVSVASHPSNSTTEIVAPRRSSVKLSSVVLLPDVTDMLAEKKPSIESDGTDPDLRPNQELLDDWVDCELSKCVGTLHATAEFELSFKFRLLSIPEETSSIIQLMSGNEANTHIPSIDIVGGTTQVQAKVAFAGFSNQISGSLKGVRLDEIIAVTFTYEAGSVILDINGDIVTDQWDLTVPTRKRLSVYIGGHNGGLSAEICAVQFSALAQTKRFEAREHPLMQLEPTEQLLLEQTLKEIQRSRQWAAFDSFFGAILLGNVVCIGIEMESPPEAMNSWQIINLMFLFVFSFEFFLRIIIVQRLREKDVSRCRSLLDPWLAFDGLVIFFCAVEFMFANILPIDGAVIRLFRFIRLLKMARLVRAFRELGMLVNGMIRSVSTLIWAWLLLAIITYIAGIMIVRLSWWALAGDEAAFKEKQLEAFMTIPSAMVKLMQMATLDDWVPTLQRFIDLNSFPGYLAAISIVVCIGMCGVGVLNVVVGIMCFTAFQLDAQMTRSRQALSISEQRAALLELQARLKCYGGRPLFKSDRYIDSGDLLEAFTKDNGNRELLEVLELTGKDVVELIQAFEDDGQIEIDGLIEAIGSIEIQRYCGDDLFAMFGNGGGSYIRPNDMLFFFFCHRKLENSMVVLEEKLKSALSLCHDVLSVTHDRTFKAFTLIQHRQAPGKVMPHSAPEQTKFITLKDIINIGVESNAGQASAKLFMSLDIVAGILITLNSLLTGANTIMKSSLTLQFIFFFIDLVFTIFFLIEFLLRITLTTCIDQIAVAAKVDLGDDEGDVVLSPDALLKLEQLQGKMKLFGIVPPLPVGGPLTVLCHMPVMLRDLQTLFDFFVVFVCLIDTAIFEPLKFAGSFEGNLSMISMLRIFRLLRLTRFLRTLRLAPQLQMLVRSLFDTWKSIAVILCTMILFLFGFAVFTVDTINRSGADGSDSDGMQAIYPSVPMAMLTCWQMVTFDAWGPLFMLAVDEDFPLVAGFIIILMAFLGLGIIKMAIGVTSASAVMLSQGQHKEKRREELVEFIKAMKELSTFAKEHFGSTVLPQEVFENILNIRMYPRMSAVNKFTYDGKSLGSTLPAEIAERIIELAEQPHLAHELHMILHRAQLSPPLVKQIVETVDYHRTGFISIDAFTKGGISLKEDLANIDLFASAVTLRLMRQKFTSMSVLLRTIHDKVDRLIQNVDAVVHRTPPKQVIDERPADLSGLSTAGHQSLVNLENSSDHALDGAQCTSRMRVLRGSGRILVDGTTVRGTPGMTAFRHELMPGDLIIWEQGGKGALVSAVVVSVPSMERLTIRDSISAESFGQEPLPYAISRSVENKDMVSTELVMEHHDMMMPACMSPRSSQQFLQWEVASRSSELKEFSELVQEHMLLAIQSKDLEREIASLANRKRAVLAMLGFRHNLEAKRGVPLSSYEE